MIGSAALRYKRLKDYRKCRCMIVGIRAGQLNQGADSMMTEDLARSLSFAGNWWSIRVIQVNGETYIAEVNGETTIEHVLKQLGSICLPLQTPNKFKTQIISP